jgi:cation/acetate symporter
MDRGQEAGAYGRLAALFGGALLILVIVLALLGHFGLPDVVIGTVLGGATLVAVTTIGINASTLQTSEFHLAARLVPAPVNGAASAVAVISATIFLGLAGTAFTDASSAAAVVIGLSLGFLILAVGIAPYFRKSGAFGVVDFLGIRYGGASVRVSSAVVVVCALLAGLAAAIAAASWITTVLLGVSAGVAMAIVTTIVLCSTLLGGVRAITRAAIVEYLVVAFAFLLPVTIVAVREYWLPFPPLVAGLAIKEAALLVLASGKDLAAFPGDLFSNIGSMTPSLVTIIVLAVGVASLPHLLLRSATVRGPDRARRSVGWAFLLVLVVALTAPAYAAFAKLFVLREVADGAIETRPDWIFTLGNLGLVKICGTAAVSVDAVLAACSALPGFTGNVPANDLAISGDAVVLAAPAIFGLPYVSTALVATGALVAALAAAKAMAFGIASAIGHDLYGSVIGVHASAGRRLIVTRLVMLLAIATAAWAVARGGVTVFGLAPVAISLSAAGLFPALILAVY